MAQSLPRFCPRCGTETVANQKFCAHCGLDMSQVQSAPPSPSALPKHPPVQNHETFSAMGKFGGHLKAAWEAFSSKIPMPISSFISALGIRRVGILLALVVVLGFGIVELVKALSTLRQPSITTIPLGTTVDYEGVDITVVNAQKSLSFLDDPHSVSDGMLRLQLQAQNKTSLTLKLSYKAIAHVTVPDGKIFSPVYVRPEEQQLASKATQTNLIDFAVPQNVRVDQVVLHLGSVDEAQLDIPLNGHVNVDQYAPKTVHPNQQISYYGLNWSLTDASVQFHIDGVQASKGMRYLILTLKVDNPLFQEAIPGSPYDYVQLRANKAAIQLKAATLPVSFEPGAIGKIGTLTFLVPQDNTSFTLTLSNPSDGSNVPNPNATATFRF